MRNPFFIAARLGDEPISLIHLVIMQIAIVKTQERAPVFGTFKEPSGAGK